MKHQQEVCLSRGLAAVQATLELTRDQEQSSYHNAELKPTWKQTPPFFTRSYLSATGADNICPVQNLSGPQEVRAILSCFVKHDDPAYNSKHPLNLQIKNHKKHNIKCQSKLFTS